MNPTRCLLSALLLAAAASSVFAGSVNDRSRWTSVDKIREAFNNPASSVGTVETPTVDVNNKDIGKSREVPLRGMTTTETPGMRDVGTVEQKNVDIKQHGVSVSETGVHPSPLTNFTTRRAPTGNNFAAASSAMRAVDRAPTTARRIQVSSPEGLEELKKQLNRTP